MSNNLNFRYMGSLDENSVNDIYRLFTNLTSSVNNTNNQENIDNEIVPGTSDTVTNIKRKLHELRSVILKALFKQSMIHAVDLVQCNVNQSEKYKVADQEDIKENNSCVICLDNILVNQYVVKLSCSHLFHSHCFSSYLLSDTVACPVCRKTSDNKFTPLSEHKVELPNSILAELDELDSFVSELPVGPDESPGPYTLNYMFMNSF